MYSRVITRCSRSAILFIVDCSLSMRDRVRFANTEMSKMEAASIIINHMIEELVARATRGNYIRDYYDIGVIGYSGDMAESLLAENDRVFIDVERVAELMPQPKTVYINQKYADGTVERMPFNIHFWVEPTASGVSPMYDAMVMAKDALRSWCSDPRNKRSIPPIILHIGDGVSSDADDDDLREITDDIKALRVAGGNVLLLNVYLASTGDGDESEELYPSEESFVTQDADKRFLYSISSSFPNELMQRVAQLSSSESCGPFKAFASNISPISVLSIMSIGTQHTSPIVCNEYGSMCLHNIP